MLFFVPGGLCMQCTHIKVHQNLIFHQVSGNWCTHLFTELFCTKKYFCNLLRIKHPCLVIVRLDSDSIWQFLQYPVSPTFLIACFEWKCFESKQLCIGLLEKYNWISIADIWSYLIWVCTAGMHLMDASWNIYQLEIYAHATLHNVYSIFFPQRSGNQSLDGSGRFFMFPFLPISQPFIHFCHPWDIMK